MTLQELLKKDKKIFVTSLLLGMLLTIIFGNSSFAFGIIGIGMGVSGIYKLKNKKNVLQGDAMDDWTSGIAFYMFAPAQIVMGLILLGSLIYYSVF